MADGYGRVLLKLLDQCEGISEQNPFAQLRLQSIRCKYSAGERSRLPLITGSRTIDHSLHSEKF
jgi:hypothetical protein